MRRLFHSGFLALITLLTLTPLTFASQTSVLLPSSVGNYQQWTPKNGSNHVTMVDETTCNGTTDYNHESTVGQRDSYGIALSSIPDGSTITQVDITPCASRNTTGATGSTFDVFYRLNGVDSADAGAYALANTTTPVVLSTTSFASLSAVKSSTTTLEIGGVYSAGSRGVRLSQIATQVTYTPLATPSGLTAVATGSGVTLSWTDNSSNENGFKIERSDNGGAFVEINTVGQNVKTYNDPGLVTGTYDYRVRSYNSGGNSGYTSTATAYVINAPSGLTAVATGSAVTIIWSDNSSNEDGFKIERSTNGGAYTQIKTVGANSRSYNDPSLTTGNTYTYRLRAYKSTSNSDYSNTDSALILGQPGSFAAIPVGSDMTLTWTDNATGEDGYIVQRSDNGGAFVQIASLSANTTSYPDTGLAAGTYAYVVYAYTVSGDKSNNSTGTGYIINAPSELWSSGTGSTIALHWSDNSSNEFGFKVEIATGAGSFVLFKNLSANATSTSATLLAPNSYSFRVRAYAGSTSYSDYSNTATSTVLDTPTGLGASVFGSDVTLNWTDNATGEDGYFIQRSDNGFGFLVVGVVGADVSTFLDPGLASGNYEYRVQSYKDFDVSAYSATTSAVLP